MEHETANEQAIERDSQLVTNVLAVLCHHFLCDQEMPTFHKHPALNIFQASWIENSLVCGDCATLGTVVLLILSVLGQLVAVLLVHVKEQVVSTEIDSKQEGTGDYSASAIIIL